MACEWRVSVRIHDTIALACKPTGLAFVACVGSNERAAWEKSSASIAKWIQPHHINTPRIRRWRYAMRSRRCVVVGLEARIHSRDVRFCACACDSIQFIYICNA